MRRSYSRVFTALVAMALISWWVVTPVYAALEDYEQDPNGLSKDGAPPPPGGDEGDDEEEVLIRARPGQIDTHPSIDEFGLRTVPATTSDVNWLTQILERLGLDF